MVTVGGSGMGAAVCHRLARDGRAVAVLDLQAAAAATIAIAINAHGGRAIAITADITQPEQIQLLRPYLLPIHSLHQYQILYIYL